MTDVAIALLFLLGGFLIGVPVGIGLNELSHKLNPEQTSMVAER
jgi:hypothetical protein